MEESSGDIVSKRCKIKELEKLLTLKQLGKINFFSFTHNNIWILMREEIGWAKKVGVVRIRKLTWTLVNELVVKEMISSYNHAYQYGKLKGRQINVKEGVARIFGMSHIRGLYQLEGKVITQLLHLTSLEMNMSITYHAQVI